PHLLGSALHVAGKLSAASGSFLNIVKLPSGQCSLDGRVQAAGSEGISNLAQALDLALDGNAIRTIEQLSQGLHLHLDGITLLFIKQAITINCQGGFDCFEQALSVDLLLAWRPSGLVFSSLLEGILQHPRNLAVGKAVGWLDLNARLDTRGQLA